MSTDRPRRDVSGHNYRSLSDYGFPDSPVVGSNTKETQKEVKAENNESSSEQCEEEIRCRDQPGSFPLKKPLIMRR